MSIAFQCKCGKAGKVADSFAGKTIACPECKGPVSLPPLSPPIVNERSSWSIAAAALAGAVLGTIVGFGLAELFEPPDISPAPPTVEATPQQVAANRLMSSRGLGVNRDQMVGELEDVYRFQNIKEDGDSMTFQIGNGVTVVMRGPADDVSSVLIIGADDPAHATDMVRAMMAVSKQVWHDRQWLSAWLEGGFKKVDSTYCVHTTRAGVVVSLATDKIDSTDIVVLEVHKSPTTPPTQDELRL